VINELIITLAPSSSGFQGSLAIGTCPHLEIQQELFEYCFALSYNHNSLPVVLLSDPLSILSITSPVRICLEPPNSRFVTLLLRKEATLLFFGNKGAGEPWSEKKNRL
jgi:hypothetical protein